MKTLLEALESGTGSPVSIDSLTATSRVTFAAMESLRTDGAVRI